MIGYPAAVIPFKKYTVQTLTQGMAMQLVYTGEHVVHICFCRSDFQEPVLSSQDVRPEN